MGGLATFSGLGALGISSLIGVPGTPFPFEMPMSDFMFTHIKTTSLIQSVAGVFIAFSAFMFLRRKLWALLALAVFCILNAAWVVTFGFYWVKTVLSIGNHNQLIAQIFTSAMAGMGILTMLSMAAVFLLCLWFLRDPRVLAHFRTVTHERR